MLSPNPESVFPDQILFSRKLMFETAIIIENFKILSDGRIGKSKWFHKLEPKPSSKHQNGTIGPVQHIRLFRDFSFLDVRKTKIG
jgi:hypothetical protein